MSDQFFRITKRIFILGCFQAFLVFLLIYPLYRLQVMHRGQYETLSQNNRIVVRALPAKRGELLDRCGTPLAQNRSGFRLVAMIQNRKQLSQLLTHLTPIIDLKKVNEEALFRFVKKNPAYLSPVTVKSGLTWEEVARLELNMSQLDGVSVVPDYVRFYPLGDRASHFLGYVGAPNKVEESQYSLPRTEGIQVGKQGLELTLETTLHGREGAEVLELNAKRQVVRMIEKREPVPGQNVQLSLSLALQKYVSERIQVHESATVIVLDIQTGDILAMASHPGFDPHIFCAGVTHSHWRSLQDNPYKPLINKATTGLYAPGSTIKGLFVLSALEHKMLMPQTCMMCSGVMTFSGHKYHCWMHKWGGHGSTSAHEALVRSCDLFMYGLARKLGVVRMKSILEEFGLGVPPPKDFLMSVRTGLIPNPTWKRSVKGKPWLPGDTILMSIGQGYLLSTPLELAVMIARFASGKKVHPRYLRSEKDPVFKPLEVSSDHLKFIQKAFFDVVNHPRGTAFRWRITDENKRMAGKTGTSQVCRISLSERMRGVRKNADKEWKVRDHGLYVGYGPTHNPRYAICCVVEHGGGGSSAALIARDVLQYAQEMNIVSCDVFS